MENNQHSNNQNVASKEAVTTFTNSQPGQQLPTENSSISNEGTSSTEHENHSESSLPQNDDETLGTP